MNRVFELITEVRAKHPHDDFFANFAQSLTHNPLKRSYYLAYERAFRFLDPPCWEQLKQRSIGHFRQHRIGQHKEGFFNQLNEAFAYRHLVTRSFSHVRLLPEDGTTKPDIAYRSDGKQKFCEVKTIGLSFDEVERRRSLTHSDRSCYRLLDARFFNKLASDLQNAHAQISSQGADGLIFILVQFDDPSLDNYGSYRSQLTTFLRESSYKEVFMKVGIRGRRCVQTVWTRRHSGA